MEQSARNSRRHHTILDEHAKLLTIVRSPWQTAAAEQSDGEKAATSAFAANLAAPSATFDSFSHFKKAITCVRKDQTAWLKRMPQHDQGAQPGKGDKNGPDGDKYADEGRSRSSYVEHALQRAGDDERRNARMVGIE